MGGTIFHKGNAQFGDDGIALLPRGKVLPAPGQNLNAGSKSKPSVTEP